MTCCGRRFIPVIWRKRVVDLNTAVFQQDGAPPHCSNRTLEYLRQYFSGDRLILGRTDNPWPPYSPDLNLPDYFLWGYLKNLVYKDNPPTIERLNCQKRTSNTKSGEFWQTCWSALLTILMLGWQESFSNVGLGSNILSITRKSRKKNGTFCKCFYVLKLLVVPHHWRKFQKKISSTVGNVANQNCKVFCDPPRIYLSVVWYKITIIELDLKDRFICTVTYQA